MSKLKDINLNDLGIKKSKSEILGFVGGTAERFIDNEQAEMNFNAFDSSFSTKRKTSEPESYYLRKKMNNSPNMNSKFLKYINIIENIKDKPGQYLDRRAEWEKELEPEEFVPSPKQPEKIIPLTFRKFFYQTFSKNISEYALKNPEKLPNLIAGIKNDILKDSLTWLDFVSDKQVNDIICQIDNYSQKGKVYKKSGEFQNVPEVIQWIIDTNLKMRYESADWNKDGVKTFSEEQGNLLIINATLHKEIEIKTEKSKDDLNRFFSWKNSKNPPEFPSTFPLPLYRVWENFAAVITYPLKNNFQFIIIDKRALVGWKDFRELEIKYDEENLTTYFLRKMEGGFKQLTYYNACAFISE